MDMFDSGAMKARRCFYAKDYAGAHKHFADMFHAYPKAWWLALEAFRSMCELERHDSHCDMEKKYLFFSPKYKINSYQKNLYSGHSSFQYHVVPVDTMNFKDLSVGLMDANRAVFHQHWVKELYWRAQSLQDGIMQIDKSIGMLKAYKLCGAKVVWTLHNIHDHDSTDLQIQLCSQVHRELARLSDTIYVHTRGSIAQLSEQCGLDVTDKCTLLHHPLYDNLLEMNEGHKPQEVDVNRLAQKKVLVCLGMLRPYKCIPDLLTAFSEFTHQYRDHSMYMIIGGKVYDDNIRHIFNQLDPLVRDRVLLIDRVLSDAEMVWMLNAAHVSAAPYQKILISGNYYLSATFRKPTIAPHLGMFAEVLRDDETGFIYDGSRSGLVDAISRVNRLTITRLAEIGEACYKDHKHQTISATSRRFFQTIEELW